MRDPLLKNWCVGVNIKFMEPCLERDSISKFQKANHNCAKYVKLYVFEEMLFLDTTHLAQYSDGWRAALLAGLLCQERRCFTALMSGTELMVT